MKKLLLILALTIISTISPNSFAQLSLKDDSSTFKEENPIGGKLSAEKFKEINGLSRYSGTIQGFSGFCKFPIDSQKVFYNYFVERITSLKLTKEENEIINNSFKQITYDVRKNGINGLTCEKFKPDFEKIIKEITSQ